MLLKVFSAKYNRPSGNQIAYSCLDGIAVNGPALDGSLKKRRVDYSPGCASPSSQKLRHDPSDLRPIRHAESPTPTVPSSLWQLTINHNGQAPRHFAVAELR